MYHQICILDDNASSRAESGTVQTVPLSVRYDAHEKNRAMRDRPKKWHVEPSRNHAGGKHRATWEEAGPDADLPADAVFDCRGLLPNTRECYTSYDGPTAAAPS